MLSRLWGKITGADKGKKYPDQQGSLLGRSGDFIIIYPYGLYCDLPSGAMFRNIGDGMAIPATIDRPAEAAQGEPVFYHPQQTALSSPEITAILISKQATQAAAM